MNAAGMRVLRDLAMRGGWALATLAVLQCVSALQFLGVASKYGSLAFLLLMLLAIFPLRTPSRRLLITLPIARADIDRLQWLFTGGLIAGLATTANVAAWAIGTVILDPAPDSMRVAMLLFGTPGLIGLLMITHRWSVVGIAPANQDRALLLPILIYPAFLMICGALSTISTFWTVVVFASFGLGWFVMILFFLSPTNYRRWINRTPAQSAQNHATNRVCFTPSNLGLTATIGLLIGTLFGWLAPARAEVSLTVAIMMVFLGTAYPIKVLRSLPLSLDRCTVLILAGFIVPSSAAVTAYIGARSLFGIGRTLPTFSWVLPIVGTISLLAPILVKAAHGARGGQHSFGLYLGFLLLSVHQGGALLSFFRTEPVVVHLMAVAMLAIAYAWLRYELRTGTMLYRYRAQFNYWGLS